MANFDDIQMFVTLAQKRGVREAADSLNLPASTISRAVTRLEKKFGLLLVERSARGVRLTDAGRDYLIHCQEALQRLREGEDSLNLYRKDPKGKLTIGLPTTFAQEMVLPFLKGFVEEYPDLRIRFILHECDHPDPPENSELDIFFQAGKPKESSWKVRAFPAVVMCLAATPQYLQKAGIPQTPEDLHRHRFVSWGPGGDKLRLKLLSKLKSVTIEVPLQISITHARMQNQMTQMGLGIGYLQLWEVQPALESEALELVLPEWQPEPVAFYALFRQRSSMMPKIEAFMKSVGQYIATDHDPRQLRGCPKKR